MFSSYKYIIQSHKYIFIFILLFLLTLFYSSLENDVSLPKEGGEGLGADLHRAEQISYQVRGFPYNSESLSGPPQLAKYCVIRSIIMIIFKILKILTTFSRRRIGDSKRPRSVSVAEMAALQVWKSFDLSQKSD